MRRVRCCICDKILGEIRDARLHKDIDYICKTCKENLCAPMMDKTTRDSYDQYPEYDFMEAIQKVMRGYP